MPFGIGQSIGAQLDRVDVAIATMGGLVETQVQDAIDAFERRDVALARTVVERDADIDQHERRIEHMVVQLLEARRVSGPALRRAMTSIKIAAELERVGDLSKNVAKRSTVLADVTDPDPTAKVMPVVARMGRRALGQFGESLDALLRRDPAVAVMVRNSDDQIDDLYNSIFREILLMMSQYTAGIVMGTHLVFVAKNFERIGDHATNIAERVHFSLTGEELIDERPKTDMTSTEAAVS